MGYKLSRNGTRKSSSYDQVARLTIRLYDDEIDQAEEIAEKLNVGSVNQVAKYLVLNAERLSLVEKNNLLEEKAIREKKLENQLRRIGLNVNQIAFKMNASDSQSNLFYGDINRELNGIKRSLKELSKKVGR